MNRSFRSSRPDLLSRLIAFDRRRPNLPFEHAAVFSLGATVLRSAFERQRSPLGRALRVLGGVALIARAASGREGPVRKVRDFAQSGSAMRRGR